MQIRDVVKRFRRKPPKICENQGMTPFARWLQRQMRISGFGDNQSMLANYMDPPAGTSTINAWFTRDAIPGPDLCRRLARALKVPADDVLRIAGHLDDDPEPTDAAIPGWLRDMLPLLTQLDESEAPALEHSARAVLEMRELRAAYDAREPEPRKP